MGRLTADYTAQWVWYWCEAGHALAEVPEDRWSIELTTCHLTREWASHEDREIRSVNVDNSACGAAIHLFDDDEVARGAFAVGGAAAVFALAADLARQLFESRRR